MQTPNAFPSPVSGEGEGEGNIRGNHPYLYPLPPKEGEEARI